jgi:type I restriction enzyme R subunit
MLSTLANRLLRLDKQINEHEKKQLEQKAGGKGITQIVKELLNAHDPDTIEDIKSRARAESPNVSPVEIEEKVKKHHEQLLEKAVAVFNNPELRDYIVDVRKKYDQIIDTVNIDAVSKSGWVKDQKAAAEGVIMEFTQWIEEHKNEITALQIFYDQPYRRRELTFSMIKELTENILLTKPTIAPLNVWKAYQQLEKVVGQPKNELIALVSLIRRVAGIDKELTPYDKTVDKNFADWVWKKQQGATIKFTKEQMQWLYMIKDHIATSIHLNQEDLDYTPFDAVGGRGKMWQLFGTEMDTIIEELNEVLAA